MAARVSVGTEIAPRTAATVSRDTDPPAAKAGPKRRTRPRVGGDGFEASAPLTRAWPVMTLTMLRAARAAPQRKSRGSPAQLFVGVREGEVHDDDRRQQPHAQRE